MSVECDKFPPSNNSSNIKISSSTPQKSEFVRVNGILKKIAITEVEVDGEGIIQVEAVKTGEEVTLTEKEVEEKVEVDSSNDGGEKLEVKSDKYTASPSKSKKCTESPSKKNKCTSSKSNKFPELPSKSNKCTASPSKSNKCTASPSTSNKCTASPSTSNKCIASHQCDKSSTTQSDEKNIK